MPRSEVNVYIVMSMPDPDDCIAIEVEVTGCFEFQETRDLALDLADERGVAVGIFVLQFIAEPEVTSSSKS